MCIQWQHVIPKRDEHAAHNLSYDNGSTKGFTRASGYVNLPEH